GDTYWRLVAVVAILDALGTVLIPLTYSLFGPKAAHQASAPDPAVGPTVGTPFAPATGPAYAPAPATAASAATSATAYPRLDPAGGLRLEWPRYINGQPLPARADGTPDFTGVAGY
ncbi:MAG: hypothetical protein JF618_10250, partial [Leifsonia sp.]|nr:hypothetical protein [Leifsonia sp.]